jgi:AcrR family transcriptional regulator
MAPSTPASKDSQKRAEIGRDPAPASAPVPPRPATRRRTPPTRRTVFSVDVIVAAAINVLDESGVGGLSMRRVAERLGTGPASLYAHVSSKDELLELMFDELVGQVHLVDPDPTRWREQAHQMLRELRDILVAHRDAALAGLGRIPTSPKTLVATEALVAVLRAGGLSDRAVALGLDQLILYVSACAFETGIRANSGLTDAQAATYFAEVHAFYGALPAEQFPVLASIAPEMTGHDADERFAFGIDVLIAGLEAQ